jgi:hypothetical protein
MPSIEPSNQNAVDERFMKIFIVVNRQMRSVVLQANARFVGPGQKVKLSLRLDEFHNDLK